MLIACNNWVCTTGYGGPELRQRITDRNDTLYHTIDRSSVSGSLYMYRQIKEETSAALYEAKDEKCSRLFHKFAGNPPEIRPRSKRSLRCNASFANSPISRMIIWNRLLRMVSETMRTMNQATEQQERLKGPANRDGFATTDAVTGQCLCISGPMPRPRNSGNIRIL